MILKRLFFSIIIVPWLFFVFMPFMVFQVIALLTISPIFWLFTGKGLTEEIMDLMPNWIFDICGLKPL